MEMNSYIDTGLPCDLQPLSCAVAPVKGARLEDTQQSLCCNAHDRCFSQLWLACTLVQPTSAICSSLLYYLPDERHATCTEEAGSSRWSSTSMSGDQKSRISLLNAIVLHQPLLAWRHLRHPQYKGIHSLERQTCSRTDV